MSSWKLKFARRRASLFLRTSICAPVCMVYFFHAQDTHIFAFNPMFNNATYVNTNSRDTMMLHNLVLVFAE